LLSIAGHGVSLILVPVLSVVLGPKEGGVFASLLLAWNNVFKVIAYRHTVPLAKGYWLRSPPSARSSGRSSSSRRRSRPCTARSPSSRSPRSGRRARGERVRVAQRQAAAASMALSALLSGFSGTSGPLKGVAIRILRLPRLHHVVGLSAVVSLVGDAVKLGILAEPGSSPTWNSRCSCSRCR
jgi:uncharacterized protein